MSISYEPSWNSLNGYPLAPWFRDAKFGIYTHWGPYSVAAYGRNGTWYPRGMYEEKSENHRYHCRTFGHPSTFGYKDFIPKFTAEKFDPDQWAEIFKNSGAKFAGPVVVHHDNFAMWDSKVNPWNSMQMGPGRDVTGELEKAIRSQGMKFAATFHHSHNWWFFIKELGLDTLDPAFSGLYSRRTDANERPDQKYLDDWRGQIFEVLDNYQPDLIWFDFGLGSIREKYRKEMLAYYYNRAQEWKRDVVVTYKCMHGSHNLPPNTGLIDIEVGKMNTLTPSPWITDTTLDAGPLGTWSHTNSVGFKSGERLVHNLVDRVSKNGYLLLNVGPRADGSIPEGAQECLQTIGKWLEINGEAIYGTVPWFLSGEGPTTTEGGDHFNEDNEVRFTSHDVRYTSKDDAIYAICLGRPGDVVTLSTFKGCKFLYPEDIRNITMLGVDGDLKWALNDDGLNIEVPRKVPSDIAVALRIRTK